MQEPSTGRSCIFYFSSADVYQLSPVVTGPYAAVPVQMDVSYRLSGLRDAA